MAEPQIINVNVKKPGHVIGTIVTIIVIAVLVQWARFGSAIHALQNGQAIVLPANYFPFNGFWGKDINGKTTKNPVQPTK